MNTKRDRLQVIYDILKAIREKNNNIKPTHIMYKANLSSHMMNDYLSELKKRKFIVENSVKKGRTYSLTKKGFEYLNKYKLIQDFSTSFGLNEEEERF